MRAVVEGEMEEFDYLNSNLSAVFNEQLKVRSLESFEQEVAERARLLFNLKFSLDDAIARIKQNIAWEFDDAWAYQVPAIYSRIDAIVKDRYSRMEGRKD